MITFILGLIAGVALGYIFRVQIASLVARFHK